LVICVATIIPVGAVILLLLLGCIAALMGVITRSGRESDDWEIDYNELEVGEQLGAGGFGQVFKATWKGTEVAVKVVAADKISREMEKSFKDEVRLSLRLFSEKSLHSAHLFNRGLPPGEGNDGAATPQRGAVHGSVDQATQDVYCDGVHGPRIPL
jgi:hypothetical protein